MDWVNSIAVQLATGEEEMPTEEELQAKEDDADWDYDRFVDNQL